jgi:oligopeptide transport system permease protein
MPNHEDIPVTGTDPIGQTEVAALEPHPGQEAPSTGVWRAAGKRLLRDRVGMVCLAIVLLYFIVIIASSFGVVASDWRVERGVSFASPTFMGHVVNLENAAGAAAANQPRTDISDVDPLAPRYAEWDKRVANSPVVTPPRKETLAFGADKFGRDVLKKAIKGAQVSVLVGISAAIAATIIGSILGALAGYFRGWIDDVLEWFYSIFTSIPYILLILAFSAVFRSNAVLAHAGIATIVCVLAFTGWTSVYRLMRAEYIKHRNRDYVRAAEAIGVSNMSRMFVHILPNASHVVLVQLSLLTVAFIKAEVILSFLGLGVPVEVVSWGTMLAEAQGELVIDKWWQLVAAGAGMAILVTAFALFTDSLRDALDPKLNQ